MPEIWGASGGRLVLPVDVDIESEAACSQDEMLGSGALKINPFEDSVYINEYGEQKVVVKEGGWKIALPPGRRGHGASLQFWLDFETEGNKNDVELPMGRVYFSANCWREEELERGKLAIAPLIADYEVAQQALEDQLSHETGDRRLDGTDPLKTIVAYKDMTELIVRRDEKLRKLKDAEKYLPRNADSLPQAAWPGGTEALAIAPVEMFIKRKRVFRDEFHIIGTWEATPVEVDELVER